jgi:predicted nucleotidyltransferase
MCWNSSPELPIDQLSTFCQHWYISKLSLFGSVLRDDFRPDSDIDILVEFETGYTPEFLKLHQIQEDLSALLGRRTVDLVTPKFLNHRIRIVSYPKQRFTMSQRDDLVYVGTWWILPTKRSDLYKV